jgi:ubiquinone/menaquinone biosynthesis C-methylase UbiE
MFRDITAPYHALESWFYDRAVARAIADMIDERPDLLRQLIDSMPAEGRLLDAGCGGGQLAIALAGKNRGWWITGVDLSREQIRRAEKRGRKLTERLSFITGSVLALPFEPDTFDGLISVCSIKHWQEPVRGLNECLRVLRPGAPLAVLEVDPDYRGDDGTAFIARQHVPPCLKPLAMAGFKWKIAARSLSFKKAESVFNSLPVSGVQAARVPGMPLWIIRARKDSPGIQSRNNCI